MSGPFRDTPVAHEDWEEQERILRRSLALLTAYLIVMLVPMLAWTLQSGRFTGLVLHLAAIGIVGLAQANRMAPSVRDWTPLALGPFLYVELRWLVAGAHRPHADVLVAGWERIVFPANPSATLAVSWHSAALSELLHAAYLSYYALIFAPPVFLWLGRRRLAFSKTLLALAIVYALCFTIYVLFPVDGPRFLHGPASAPDGPVRSMVVALLASGSSRGTAFPSSHVAASLVAAACALRFLRPVGVVVAILTVGVCVGAVYGGYHYAVDVLGGLLTGIVALAASIAIERYDARRSIANSLA